MILCWEDDGGVLTAKGASGYDYKVWLDAKALSGPGFQTTYHESVGHAKARAEELETQRQQRISAEPGQCRPARG